MFVIIKRKFLAAFLWRNMLHQQHLLRASSDLQTSKILPQTWTDTAQSRDTDVTSDALACGNADVDVIEDDGGLHALALDLDAVPPSVINRKYGRRDLHVTIVAVDDIEFDVEAAVVFVRHFKEVVIAAVVDVHNEAFLCAWVSPEVEGD